MIVAAPDAGKLPTSQATFEPLIEHVPSEVVAELNARPLGKSSVTLTPVANEGPAFLTFKV